MYIIHHHYNAALEKLLRQKLSSPLPSMPTLIMSNSSNIDITSSSACTSSITITTQPWRNCFAKNCPLLSPPCPHSSCLTLATSTSHRPVHVHHPSPLQRSLGETASPKTVLSSPLHAHTHHV